MQREEKLEIEDLFEAATLVAKGHKMQEVNLIKRGFKPTASFVFDLNAGEASSEYRQGRAQINPAMLKFCLNKLKDEMFSRIRDVENGEKNARVKQSRSY